MLANHEAWYKTTLFTDKIVNNLRNTPENLQVSRMKKNACQGGLDIQSTYKNQWEFHTAATNANFSL